MKKSLVVLSGVLALSLAVAPAAFAVQGEQVQPVAVEDIEQTNAAPSVQQQGIQLQPQGQTVTVVDPSGETVEVSTEATVPGVSSEDLQVFVTGQTDAGAATTEAQAEANAALAAANATGNTVNSMIATNAAVAETLAAAGASAENTAVTQEFYLGIQKTTTGEVLNGTANAVVSMPSAEEANAVVAVLVYNSTTGQWVPVPFAIANGNIVILGGQNGAYRFVSKVR